MQTKNDAIIIFFDLQQTNRFMRRTESERPVMICGGDYRNIGLSDGFAGIFRRVLSDACG